MKEIFEAIKVGEDFPLKNKRSEQHTKYLTFEKEELLMNNLGQVFLIYQAKNLGNSTNVMSRGNSIRGSMNTIHKRFREKYPNYKLSMAVRQTVKDGGIVKLYAKIESKEVYV